MRGKVGLLLCSNKVLCNFGEVTDLLRILAAVNFMPCMQVTLYISFQAHTISAMYYLPFYKWESSDTEHIKITWLRSNHWSLTQTGFDHYSPTHFTLHQHFSAVAHSLEKDIFQVPCYQKLDLCLQMIKIGTDSSYTLTSLACFLMCFFE